MIRSAVLAAVPVLVALSAFVGYRIGQAEPVPTIDSAPVISWTTPELEGLLDEHSCTRDWSGWDTSERGPLGALVGTDRGVKHVNFAEGWNALVDLDDGRNLVAVCAA